ncbi:MAG: hypothetical protein SGI96_01415, partial [Bacteroidota bacterium]|nr:hypothetical protein [Bacteroidota bacterium]
MKAKSIKGKTTEEIAGALSESMADGFKPTLAIVFISIKQDREAISKLLDEKGIQIFGATTAGEFIDGDIEAGSIVMLLLDMNPAYFKLEFIETSKETALEDATKLGVAGKEIFTNPALIIATGGVFIDGDQIIEGIIQGFGKTASSAHRE